MDEADAIVGPLLVRPSTAKVDRFVADGRLERVLTLYNQAIRKDPAEPSYPWNLAAALDRLGLSELALPYMAKAIRAAQDEGNSWLAGPHGHLAWAEAAMNADQPELAEVLLRKARALDPAVPVERYERKLRNAAAPAPGEPASNQDSARKGTAVEHLIAAHCMLVSDFELNVSTSLVDDEGVDLVFHRRGNTATLAVQVKSRSWATTTMRRSQSFIAQVSNSTFSARDDLYMLFVAVDTRFGDYGPVWFIPSIDFFLAVKPNKRDRLRFAASANPASRDKWSKYRLERSELPRRILEELAPIEADGARRRG